MDRRHRGRRPGGGGQEGRCRLTPPPAAPLPGQVRINLEDIFTAEVSSGDDDLVSQAASLEDFLEAARASEDFLDPALVGDTTGGPPPSSEEDNVKSNPWWGCIGPGASVRGGTVDGGAPRGQVLAGQSVRAVRSGTARSDRGTYCLDLT